MYKISIIIPCLNMDNYIEQCIGSILNQTFRDLEVLIIDAGSIDGTLEKLQRYSNQDERIQVIHSQKKSYGYQVNLGITRATGTYIGIVDADDEIAKDMYEVLYRTALESDADYVKGVARGFYTLCNGERVDFPIMPFESGEYGNGIEIIPQKTPSLFTKDNFLWYGLYKSNFLKQIKLHESPGAAFQDLGALFQIQTRAKKAVYIDKLVYYYRQDNVNASIHNPKGFRFIADEYIYAKQFLAGLPQEWYTAFYRKQFLHFMDRMYVMAASGNFWENTLADMLAIAKILREKNVEGVLNKKDLTEEQWEDLQLLWESPYQLYQKYRKVIEPGETALKNVIRHLGDQQGIIFGSGNFGTFVHTQLLYRGYRNVVAYCDNNIKAQGKTLYGAKVRSPQQTVQKFPYARYIIASKHYAREMQKQLEYMVVEVNDILHYSSGTDIRLFNSVLV